MTLCTNCLKPGAKNLRVGNDRGSQRDPEYNYLTLCPDCEQALLAGDLKRFHDLFSETRQITR